MYQARSSNRRGRTPHRLSSTWKQTGRGGPVKAVRACLQGRHRPWAIPCRCSCVTYATDLPCSRPASHGTWTFTAGGMCAFVWIHQAVDLVKPVNYHTGPGSPSPKLVDTATRRIVARCTHMLAYDLPRLPSARVPRADNLPLLDWARGACEMLSSAPEPRAMSCFRVCLSQPLSAVSGNDSPVSEMFLACPQFSTQYLRGEGFSWTLLC